MKKRKSNFSYSEVVNQPRKRSMFDLSHGHTTTANLGTLFPIYCEEIYPYDTFKCDSTFVSQVISAFIRPMMGNFFMDIFYFFVPNRLLMDDWAELFGFNPDAPWTNDVAVEVPQVNNPNMSSEESKALSMTIADYLQAVVPGMDYSDNSDSVSQLPFRAIAKIWNDWFLSEVTGTPVVYKPSGVQTFNANPWSPSNIFGQCPNVYKVHDRFTSALPEPQKGPAVSLPLGSIAPVLTGDSLVIGSGYPPLHMVNAATGADLANNYALGTSSTGDLGVITGTSPSIGAVNLRPDNLFADLSSATAANVNDLRYAFATQRILERAARAGTRLTEYIQSTFGVLPADARLGRAEFLGGRRCPMSVQKVAQSYGAPDSPDNPLGSLGGYSNNAGKAGYVKSFTEHGWVIGLACIRQFHTYQQGIDRAFMRKSRFDFFDPAFSHIGEQPIYSRELFSTAPSAQIFGYTEAWNELRQRSNMISGAVRSTMQNSLDVWHIGDYYANAPVLNDDFLLETPEFFDRTLQVQSTEAPQFVLDFWFNQTAVRCLPVHSTPGLLDHN